ncbi:MAG: hypothetical protein ACI9WU_004364 [Myxococcota bacterium]|jgi:hypothetical protein
MSASPDPMSFSHAETQRVVTRPEADRHDLSATQLSATQLSATQVDLQVFARRPDAPATWSSPTMTDLHAFVQPSDARLIDEEPTQPLARCLLTRKNAVLAMPVVDIEIPDAVTEAHQRAQNINVEIDEDIWFLAGGMPALMVDVEERPVVDGYTQDRSTRRYAPRRLPSALRAQLTLEEPALYL